MIRCPFLLAIYIYVGTMIWRSALVPLRSSSFTLTTHPCWQTHSTVIVVDRTTTTNTIGRQSCYRNTGNVRPNRMGPRTTGLGCRIQVPLFETIRLYQSILQSPTDNNVSSTFTTTTSSSAAAATAAATATAVKESETKNSTNQKKHYVFGYGSLMCPLSRQITNENLMNKFTIPIVIHQLQRIWCARTTTGYTAMGVQFTTTPTTNNATTTVAATPFCTGILIGTIDSIELEDLDRRETSYNRLPVPLDTICTVPFVDTNVYDNNNENSSPYNNEHQYIKNLLKNNHYRRSANQTLDKMTANVEEQSNEDIHVWVYVPKNPIPPDVSHPILQSYIDIIIRGCFNTFGEPFARSFVSTTTGWCCNAATPHHHYWVDDRDRPMYKRADRIYSKSNTAKIDHVIFDELQKQNSMRNSNSKVCYDDDTSSSQSTPAVFCRNTYDPLLHLEQLTHCMEQDYDSVHPMAFQHFLSQIQK